MTRVEQERMVGQYLRGEMGAAAEENFFIQVALDSDLRQTLKAFRVVETAMQKHRDAIPANRVDAYDRFITMLAPGVTGVAHPETLPPFPANAGAAGLIGEGIRLVAAKTFLWTTAIVAAGSLVLGTFILAPMLGDPSPSAPTRQRVLPTISTPGTQFPGSEATLPGRWQPGTATAFPGSVTGDRIEEKIAQDNIPSSSYTSKDRPENAHLSAANLSVKSGTPISRVEGGEQNRAEGREGTVQNSGISAQSPNRESSPAISPNALPAANEGTTAQPSTQEPLTSTQDTIKFRGQLETTKMKKP